MPSNEPSWLERRIDWRFVVEHAGNRVRYGLFREQHYKQFLPGGIVISKLHQPRKIPSELYEMAQRELTR